MKIDRTTQLSTRMATACLFLIIGVLVMNGVTGIMLVCLKFGVFPEGVIKNKMLLAYNIEALSIWRLFAGLVVMCIPVCLTVYGLYLLRGLFQHYVHGEYFSSFAAIQLGRISRIVAWWVLLSFLSEVLSNILFNGNNTFGDKIADALFSSDTITALFLSGFFSVIALILQRASEIETENRQFI